MKLSEVSYGEVLGEKITMYIMVTLTEGTGLYCDYFILCVSCTVVVVTRFVMCECVDNCVGVLVICVLVFTVLLYCFVYIYLFLFVTNVRTTATE